MQTAPYVVINYLLIYFIIFYCSLGGFTVLLTAAEKQSQARGVVLLNSAGQFGDPNKKSEKTEGENAIDKFFLKPLKEAFQRVVLGFVFWQSKQPARIEKVLKSVKHLTGFFSYYILMKNLLEAILIKLTIEVTLLLVNN